VTPLTPIDTSKVSLVTPLTPANTSKVIPVTPLTPADTSKISSVTPLTPADKFKSQFLDNLFMTSNAGNLSPPVTRGDSDYIVPVEVEGCHGTVNLQPLEFGVGKVLLHFWATRDLKDVQKCLHLRQSIERIARHAWSTNTGELR
jgi:hypothetical protein